MNTHFLNGERLLRQGRPREAVDAFHQALSQDPHDARTFAFLALAQHDAKNKDHALKAAREAVRLDPGDDFTHYVLGLIYLFNEKLIDASRSAMEALRLRPDHAEYYRLLAMIRTQENNHAEALRLVEQGLQQDPQNSDCLNLRSQLLVRLGRRDEARQTSAQALASAPDDAHSHANAGWTALHNNKTKEALGHFKESLRLEPGNAWAKAGLAEALKARNPVYRVLLMFILWMNRLDGRVRIAVIVGGFVLYRLGKSLSDTNPELEPFLWPVLIAYIAFAWMTWVGVPLADLMLRLSPYGRHALSDRQRLVSDVLGLSILAVLASAGLYFWTSNPVYFVSTAQIAFLAIVSVGTLQRHRTPRYTWLLIGCGLLAFVMLFGWILMATGDHELASSLVSIFVYGFIAMMWFIALGGAGTPRRDYN